MRFFFFSPSAPEEVDFFAVFLSATVFAGALEAVAEAGALEAVVETGFPAAAIAIDVKVD